MKGGRTRLRGVGSPRNVLLSGSNDIDSINYERIKTKIRCKMKKWQKMLIILRPKEGKVVSSALNNVVIAYLLVNY